MSQRKIIFALAFLPEVIGIYFLFAVWKTPSQPSVSLFLEFPIAKAELVEKLQDLNQFEKLFTDPAKDSVCTLRPLDLEASQGPYAQAEWQDSSGKICHQVLVSDVVANQAVQYRFKVLKGVQVEGKIQVAIVQREPQDLSQVRMEVKLDRPLTYFERFMVYHSPLWPFSLKLRQI